MHGMCIDKANNMYVFGGQVSLSAQNNAGECCVLLCRVIDVVWLVLVSCVCLAFVWSDQMRHRRLLHASMHNLLLCTDSLVDCKPFCCRLLRASFLDLLLCSGHVDSQHVSSVQCWLLKTNTNGKRLHCGMILFVCCVVCGSLVIAFASTFCCFGM